MVTEERNDKQIYGNCLPSHVAKRLLSANLVDGD
jgi:hypothetical protein